MANEGDLNKINGDIFYAGDITALLNVDGSILNDAMQEIFNADYIGFSSKLSGIGTPNLKNVDFDTFQTDSMTKTGNTEYDSTNDWYWGYPTDISTFDSFDEFSDSTVDVLKWDVTVTATAAATSSVTEDSTNQTITAAHTSTGGGPLGTADSETIDLFSDIDYVIIDIVTNSVSGTGTNATAIKIGGVSILTHIDGAGDLELVRIGNRTYWRFNDGGGFTSWVGITTAGNGELSFFTTSGGTTSDGSATIAINFVRNVTAIDGDSTIQSPVETSVATITNAIVINNVLSTSSISPLLSADNGSNFESATSTEIHRFSNTGTQLISKFTINGTGAISEYATKYNFY